QRFYFLRQHVLPKLIHKIGHEKFTASNLIKMDQQCRNAAKRFLHLPSTTNSSFFHLSNRLGGLALPQLQYDIPRLFGARMNRLKQSETWFVKEVTKTNWFNKELERVCRMCPANNNNQKRLLNDIEKIERGHLCFATSGSLMNRHLSATTELWTDRFLQFLKLRSNCLGWKRHSSSTEFNSRCRHGCESSESLYHILNQCRIT
ncbi:unnamed protein product, partial [Ectocarpus sp. 12 AP-2014]